MKEGEKEGCVCRESGPADRALVPDDSRGAAHEP